MTERDRRRNIVDHLRAGETQSAADELAGSLESYPGDGLLHHAIGLAFASKGTLAAAREHLEAAAQLAPDSAPILADLAQVRLARGKAEEAVESAERALEIDPSLAISHFTLGRACLAMESARQSRHPGAPPAGFDFPLLDGRTALYLRALNEMEIALDASPPFIVAVRAALAFAYTRAGHYHAALEQLRAELVEMLSQAGRPSGEEADRVADRIRSLEHEIAREDYWSAVAEDGLSAIAGDRREGAEALLRAAHARAVSGDETDLVEAIQRARAAGYQPRQALVERYESEDAIFQQLSDVHALIAGGLECVHEGVLRFLPFSRLESVTFGAPAYWRAARVNMSSGDALDLVVPSLYRLALRSTNDLIQSGRFTQFKYAPGETRYARAIGTRNFSTEEGIIPFADVKAIRFI